MVVGWAKGAETPQNRRVVDFWPVSSGHGSYQYVRYGGRQFGAPTWGSVRAATMANAATIVAAAAIWTCRNGSTDLTIGHET